MKVYVNQTTGETEDTSQSKNKNSKMDNDAQGAVMFQQSGSAEKSNTPDGCCPAQYSYCSRFSFGPRGDNVTEVLFVAEVEIIRG